MQLLEKLNEEHIECPLLWVDETLAKYFKENQEKVKHCGLLWVREEWVSSSSPVEDRGHDFHDEYPKYVEYFSKHLYTASLSLYTGNHDDAKLELDLVHKALVGLTKPHTRIKPVTTYLADSLRWCLNHLTGSQDSLSQEETQTLKTAWENLKTCKKSQAVILYMKTCAANRLLILPAEESTKLFSSMWKSIIPLDPDYHVWYHYAFQNLRRQRRRLTKMNILAPSKKEVTFCEKALSLAPNNLMSMFDYAILLKDCLWLTVFQTFMPKDAVAEFPFDDIQNSLEKCVKYFEKALTNAKKHNLDEWICKIKMERAETLFFVGNNKDSRQKGLSLLLECKDEHPDNAFVYQKLGNIYRFGGPGSFDGLDDFQDDRTAKLYFEQAVRLEQSNYFECLKCYLKLYTRNVTLNDTQEAITLSTFALEIAEKRLRDYLEVYHILIWRGYLLWNQRAMDTTSNKIKAQQDWINAWKRFPDKRSNILNEILFSFPKWNRFNKPHNISCAELRKHLEKSSLDSTFSSDDAEALYALLQDTNNFQERSKFESRIRNQQTRNITESNKLGFAKQNWFDQNNESGLMAHNSWRKNSKALRKNENLADLDDNWRIKK